MSNARAWLLIAVAALFAGGMSTAHAQTPAPAAPGPTAAPAAAEPAAPVIAEEPPPPPPSECFPACRAGFVCSDGTCISACNPPCRAGEQCTASGACEPDQAPPPPTYVGTMREADVPPPPVPVEGVETHDGFMLRFTVGFGGGSMSEAYDGILLGPATSNGEATYSGAGVTLALDLGAALSPNFTLHGRLGMMQLPEPKLETGGEEVTLEDISVVSALLGIGATYTLMPLNLYFTGVVGLGVNGLSYRPENNSDEDRGDGSDAGLALNFDIGKEWWVSRQTGIGIAARFWLTSAHFENAARESTMSLIAAALMFSLTYQ